MGKGSDIIATIRGPGMRLLTLFVLALVFACSQAAFADKCCWINAKTGTPYPHSRLVPLGMKTRDFENDPDHFYIPPGPNTPNGEFVGNWCRDSNGSWINAKTGKPYPCSRLVPLGMKTSDFENDPDHFYIPPGPNTPNGEFVGNWVRVPCPEEKPSSTAGAVKVNIEVFSLFGGHSDDRPDDRPIDHH